MPGELTFTIPYGNQLADEFSKNLADLQKEIQVFDRRLLKTYLSVDKEQNGALESPESARELAKGLGASIVVIGKLSKADENSLQLSVQLLSVTDSTLIALQEALLPLPPGLLQSQGNTSNPVANLAEQISQNSRKISCAPHQCRLVVTNFVLPSGKTSQFGILLADAFSQQLSKDGQAFTVIARDTLREFVGEERLSPKTVGDPLVARWIARQLRADAIMVGETRKTSDDTVEFSANIIRADESKGKELTINGTFRTHPSATDFIETDDLPALPKYSGTFQGVGTAFAGRDLLPSCFQMPNPGFTDDARRAHFSGAVMLEAIVGIDGQLHQVRVTRGVPFGLNETAIRTLQTWRCKPAQRDGKPIPVIVSLEVNFRLNPN